jgi:hypothetical protein
MNTLNSGTSLDAADAAIAIARRSTRTVAHLTQL